MCDVKIGWEVHNNYSNSSETGLDVYSFNLIYTTTKMSIE